MKLTALLFLGSMVVACSSEESSSPTPPVPCNQDPWQCPAGQTCWPKDTAGTFACLNSAAGVAKGDECANMVGSPTCGDGLACFQNVGEAKGRCVPFCDPTNPARGCAAGEACSTITLSGTTSSFKACIGKTTTPPADSGADSAGDGAAEAAADGASEAGGDGAAEAASDAAGD